MNEPLLPCCIDEEAAVLSPKEETRSWHGLEFVKEDFLSPLLGTTVLLPFAVAFAGVITSHNQSLAPFIPTLLSTVLLSQGIGTLTFARCSQFTTCTNVDLLSAAFFSKMATLIAQSAQQEGRPLSAPELLVHVLVLQGIFSALVGVLLCLMATLDGIWYLRFLPYPVACGFVAGVGFLVGDGGFELGTGMSFQELVAGVGSLPRSTYVDALVTVAVGSVLLALKFVNNGPMRLPLGLLIITLVVHGGAYVLQISEEELWKRDIFLNGLKGEPWTATWTELAGHFSRFRPSLLVSEGCVSMTASYAVLHIMIYPFYASGMTQLETPKEKVNLKREINMLGWLNVGLCFVAGVPSCHCYKVAIVMKDSGARTRLWVQLLGAFFLCLCFVPPLRPAVAVVPKCAFGGLVWALGVDFVSASLVESKQRVAIQEWRLVVLIALMTYFNVVIGIVLGCLLMMAFFVVEYAGITGITRRANLEEVRSFAEYTPEETAILHHSGNQVMIFWCAGYIFFGTSATLVEEIEEHLDSDPTTRFLILDFEAVPAVDASGVHALTTFAESCYRRRPPVKVCYCGLVRRLKLALANVIATTNPQGGGPRLEPHRLEHALEWAETEVLKRASGAAPKALQRQKQEVLQPQDPVLPEHKGRVLEELLEELAPEAPAAERLEVALQLAGSAELRTYSDTGSLAAGAAAEGERLFCEGDPACELMYVVAGAVSLTRLLDPETGLKLPRHHLNEAKGDVFAFEEHYELRLQRAERGTVLGAVELAAASGSASAALRMASGAAAPWCQVLVVPHEALYKAFVQHPAVGYAAMSWLGRLASQGILELLKSSKMRPYRLQVKQGTDVGERVALGRSLSLVRQFS